MKKTIRFCDICKKEYPDAYFKYKYRAKHRVFGLYGMEMERIELCETCLRKIISANNFSERNKDEQAKKECIEEIEEFRAEMLRVKERGEE